MVEGKINIKVYQYRSQRKSIIQIVLPFIDWSTFSMPNFFLSFVCLHWNKILFENITVFKDQLSVETKLAHVTNLKVAQQNFDILKKNFRILKHVFKD